MFASSIPEIIELVGSGSKYSGELKREQGKRYPHIHLHSYYFHFIIRNTKIVPNEQQQQKKIKEK